MEKAKKVYVIGTGRICGVYSSKRKAKEAIDFFDESDWDVTEIHESFLDAFPPENKKRFCVFMRKDGDIEGVKRHKVSDVFDFKAGDEFFEWEDKKGWTFQVWAKDIGQAVEIARNLHRKVFLEDSKQKGKRSKKRK